MEVADSMKKYYLIGLIIAIIFGGCATSSINKNGVIVNIVKPPKHHTGSLQCNGKNMIMSYIYVGQDSVHGAVSKTQKKLIFSYAKAALKETSFITPVGNKYMPGYDDKIYPIMSINVIKDEIKILHPREDIIQKKGSFIAQIDIKVPGSSVVCSSSKPSSIEFAYQEPIYESNKLPSNSYIEEVMVKEAVKEAVASFVPVTETIFRPVLDGDGAVGESAKMLNNDNCEMAKEILEEYVEKNRKNSKAFYNLGVSYECLAKSDDIKNIKPILIKALNAYTNAVKLDSSNETYNRAREDIYQQINVLKNVSNKSRDVKSYIKSFN